MSCIVVLDHRFCWNSKIFKISTKVDADATDSVIDLNEKYQ